MADESASPTALDRGGRVRRALVEMVAEHGLAGATMSAVARAAGVATGTAYTYYESKSDLVVAAYREVKRGLGEAAVGGLGETVSPAELFRAIWTGIYEHLAADPVQARFLLQVDSSPLAAQAHLAVLADGDDPLVAAAEDAKMSSALADLPVMVIYELGLRPAIRMAADDSLRADANLADIASACWRAVAG